MEVGTIGRLQTLKMISVKTSVWLQLSCILRVVTACILCRFLRLMGGAKAKGSDASAGGNCLINCMYCFCFLHVPLQSVGLVAAAFDREFTTGNGKKGLFGGLSKMVKPENTHENAIINSGKVQATHKMNQF